MPHISFEYSSNLETKIDIGEFCNTLRIAGIETKVFPIKGIRVRAVCCEHFSIADNNPENGFIDISVRLRGGRDLETRKRVGSRLGLAGLHKRIPRVPQEIRQYSYTNS